MTDSIEKENLVLIGAKVKPPVREAIENIAKEEDRSVSNTIARLLETHPAIQIKLDEVTAKAA